jgi:zinc transport system substrate-binding protein
MPKNKQKRRYLFMKKLTAIILILLFLIPGCAQAKKPENGKINVVCTIFPLYDWVRQILGEKSENMELTILLNGKIDLHSYQPSVDDIVKISACELFIYAGGESDGWVKKMLNETANPDMIVINLLETLGNSAKKEEIIEGMQEEEEKEEEEEGAYDEHVWLSLKNAEALCPVILDALSSLDKDNAPEYKNNSDAYIAKLSALDAGYRSVLETASVKTLLFGDRFPFRYLADDYALGYYAAFPGCSAETEASFDTIVFLAKKADELNLNTVMVTESADQSIAQTIIDNTKSKNQKILVLDSMQSVTSDNIKNGTTYLSIMENNLNILKEAVK